MMWVHDTKFAYETGFTVIKGWRPKQGIGDMWNPKTRENWKIPVSSPIFGLCLEAKKTRES
jgi:hypothetical protein